MSEISLKGIAKTFGALTVLRDIDIDIADGEFVVFVGPSGCGKSTLLRLIAGLEEISAGTLSIDGRPVNHLSPKERGIAMVFQSYALYPHMTVYKNMAFGLKLAGSSREDIKRRVLRAAEILQIDHLLDRRPAQLSGGQRQRVAIGRAIVRNPNVFLFDEPLSNLDAALRVQTRIEIAKLHQDLGATMIYVTHDQVEAMTLADKIVVLNQGNVEQIGAPLTLYHRPANLFVAGFIGSPKMNFLPCTARSGDADGIDVQFGDGHACRLPFAGDGIAPGSRLTLGLRPEHLHPTEGSLAIDIGIDVVEHLGEVSYLYARDGAGTALIVAAPGTSPAQAGQHVTVHADPAAAHLFGPDGIALPRPAGSPETLIAPADRSAPGR